MQTADLEWLVSVVSTNEVAMHRARAGAVGPLWIVGEEQTGGRGRSGRGWVSPPGNLYASLLITSPAPLHVLAQLSLVAGIAVHETVEKLGARLSPKLKWPNDVLIDGAKVSGILIESAASSFPGHHHAVIGIGINLAHHPMLSDRPATSLAAHGLTVVPREAFGVLSKLFAKSLDSWAEGDGFSAICQNWQSGALPPGTEVSVKSGVEVLSGRYAGLDTDGAMLLDEPGGNRRRITFGDVNIGV